VVSGYREGTVSLASEVHVNLPHPLSNVDQMTETFNKRGFSQQELIVLLGARSIGGAHCFTFTNRLYNAADPALDENMAQQLKNTCPAQSHADVSKDAKALSQLQPFIC
jgi:peroxidase